MAVAAACLTLPAVNERLTREVTPPWPCPAMRVGPTDPVCMSQEAVGGGGDEGGGRQV